MTTVLPALSSLEAYAPWHRHPDPWLPALSVIAARHGLDGSAPRHLPVGSNGLFVLDDGRTVVKIFAPMWPEDAATERVALDHVEGRLPVRSPRLAATGELDGWPYLVMDHVGGRPLGEVWGELTRDERVVIVDDLCALVVALHALPTAGLALPPDDWPAFVAERLAALAAEQQAHGAPAHWLESLPEFVAARAHLLVSEVEGSVFLHADLTSENLHVGRGADGCWRLTALVDFGDAMVGAPGYELAAPALFVTRGECALVERMLRGVGREPGPEESARHMMHLLVHRFMRLDYIARLPFVEASGSLEELQTSLFGS